MTTRNFDEKNSIYKSKQKKVLDVLRANRDNEVWPSNTKISTQKCVLLFIMIIYLFFIEFDKIIIEYYSKVIL